MSELVCWKLHNTDSGETHHILGDNEKQARQTACNEFRNIDWADAHITTCEQSSFVEFLKERTETSVHHLESYHRFPVDRREFIGWMNIITECLNEIDKRLKKFEPEPPKRRLMKDLVRDLEQEVRTELIGKSPFADR